MINLKGLTRVSFGDDSVRTRAIEEVAAGKRFVFEAIDSLRRLTIVDGGNNEVLRDASGGLHVLHYLSNGDAVLSTSASFVTGQSGFPSPRRNTRQCCTRSGNDNG